MSRFSNQWWGATVGGMAASASRRGRPARPGLHPGAEIGVPLTDGQGAEVVLDFVGESGAEADAWRMTRRAGAHFVVGYGADGRIELPTIDVISSERDIIGNLVGTYNDLVELMALAAQGAVTVRTQTYPLASVNDAIDDLEAGRLHGRGILVP